MCKVAFFILSLMASSGLFAETLEAVGQTFPVMEMSLEQFIKERLTTLDASGEIDKLHARWLQRASLQANHPTPLGLPRALKNTTHYYKPEIVLRHAIFDNQQRVIVPIGTRFNALEQLAYYNPCWLFFNAEDKAQLRWAQKTKNSCEQPKLILTGGAIDFAEQTFNAPIYFDQGGRITQQLHIHTLPATVKRVRNQLQIEELAIREDGHAL